MIFGIWNSHTSIGNIVGGLLAGYYVDTDWAFSFIVPGLIITVVGVLVWAFLPPRPHGKTNISIAFVLTLIGT